MLILNNYRRHSREVKSLFGKTERLCRREQYLTELVSKSKRKGGGGIYRLEREEISLARRDDFTPHVARYEPRGGLLVL
jgi:hypothetical protein